MNNSREDVGAVFVAHYQATKPWQPSMGPFDDPPTSIPLQFPSIWVCRPAVVAPRGNDRFNAAGDQQPPQRIAVIRPVGNHLAGVARSQFTERLQAAPNGNCTNKTQTTPKPTGGNGVRKEAHGYDEIDQITSVSST